jgi:LuxR family maltose regulon positive regulatory protein
METHNTNIPLLRTKLYRPPVPADHVHRSKLLEQLEKAPHRPLVLVSAPAGYGKTTLVSCWLDICDRPGAWLSLDENDSGLRQFLSYFVAAVRTLFPEAGRDTITLINARKLPSTRVLAHTMLNELDKIEQDFIVVLDDIHRIQGEVVQDFLSMILRHSSRFVQLVLVGRRDPIVPIASLRAKGLVTELRLRDLRFTADEAAEFFQGAVGPKLEKTTAAALAEKADGWVTGLRLAALAIRGQDNPGRKLLELKGSTHYVMDYMISEVLDSLPPGILHCLLSSGILRRFCAPLCDAVFEADGTSGEKEIDGQEFVKWLQENNLFVIPLDTENRWFRYHHLFWDLLRSQLKQKVSPEEIASLYSRASEWFESQGLITESIEEALMAGDIVRAAEIIEQHRHSEHEGGRWQVVERWLGKVPTEIRRKRLALRLAEMWIAYVQFQLERIPPMLEETESLPDIETAAPMLLGELNFFRGTLLYWQGDAESSVRYLETALSQISEKNLHVKCNVELNLALARHMIGQKEAAIQALTDRIRSADSSKGLLAYSIGGLAFIHVLSCELNPARVQAQRLQSVTGKIGDLNASAWSSYLLGCTHLNAYELERASRHFSVAARQRYILDTRAVIDALAGLALAQQLMQQPDKAAETMERLLVFARELNAPLYISVAYSCQARLALLQGEPISAGRWARSFEHRPDPSSLFLWLEVPSITLARVLIASGFARSALNAVKLLQSIRELSEACRFTCQTIEIVTLQALALQSQGRTEEALETLEEAVTLAGPEGWIRPFIEAGAPMAHLLDQLTQKDVAVGYIERILAAFENYGQGAEWDTLGSISEKQWSPSIPSPRRPYSLSGRTQPLAEPLTHRELDVLELLSERLQDKEVAEKLVISPKTVKTHLQNIYRKLCVQGRREAVERAMSLKILPGN